MSWDYDPAKLPVNGLAVATGEEKKNFVRFLVGDTVSSTQNVQDEEIFAALAVEPNVWCAAALCLESLAKGKGGASVQSTSAGETSVTFKSSTELNAMAKSLRSRGSLHQLPSAGGIFIADREREESDSSKIQPSIRIGMHDYFSNDPKLGSEQ